MGEGGEPYDPAVQNMNTAGKAWMGLIYADLSQSDKKIFEWTLGWNGHKTLQNQEIARRLRRTPGWVSQRKLLIQKTIERESDLSPFNGGL
jgi:hypothetical protein